MMRLALALALLLGGCSQPDPFERGQESPDTIATAPASEPAPEPRFDAVKIEAMKRRLLDMIGIADLVFDASGPVEWQVGVVPGVIGSTDQGRDLARSICRQLREAAISDEDTDVRIVDLRRLEDAPGDFRSASVGHVACPTGESLGI